VWTIFEKANAILNFFAACIGIFSGVFALLAWRKARQIRQVQADEDRRRSEPIRLILENEQTQEGHVLGYRPRRDQATRAEILGILGMYYGEPRYESSKLVPILESGDFDRMISGSTSELRFRVSKDDFERFRKRDQELQASATKKASTKKRQPMSGASPEPFEQENLCHVKLHPTR
jgi:hypothetical protein